MLTLDAPLAPLLPDAAQRALHALALPGLTPSASLMLVFAMFWLVPFARCLAKTLSELVGGLRERHREAGWRWALAGALVLCVQVAAVALYVAALGALLGQSFPEQVPALLSALAEHVAKPWAGAPFLRSAPVGALASALLVHFVGELGLWASAHPMRQARARRTQALLSQLEARQSFDDDPRGPVRYW